MNIVLPKLLRGEKRTNSLKAPTEQTKTVDSTGSVGACDINETTKATSATDKLNGDFNRTNGVNEVLDSKNGVDGGYASDKDNLSFMIREKIDCETRNIEKFIDKTVDKTVTGIVELKDDLLNYSNEEKMYANGGGGLRQRNVDRKSTNENFIKMEIEALNNAVQQNNVLPAVLSNGHAK